MPVTISPDSYFIGAARIYYRTAGSVGAWTDLGVTTDDAMAHITMEWFRPDNLNNVMGNLQGLDVLRRIHASADFTIPAINGANMAVVVPGSVATPQLTTDAGGTPGTTTLAAAAAVGDTAIKVVAITNFSPGDFVRINVAGALAEYRVIDVVGTVGAGGTGLQFRDPLLKAHANGVAAVEAVGDSRTVITAPTVRRQPSTAYNDWALVAPTGSQYGELRLLNAISDTASVDVTFGDTTLAAIKVTIAARYSGSALTTSPFMLIVPT